MLNSLLNNRLKKKGGKLYAAFVDFKVASNKVDRNILLNTTHCRKRELEEKFIERFPESTEKTRIGIVPSEGITEEFKANVGVRQECQLSPVLFNIFLDGIDEAWEKKNGETVIGWCKFYVLKYADESAEGLARMLKGFVRFADRTGMEVNVEKTKIMVSRNGGRRAQGENWTHKGKVIEVVSEFKYLGYWLSTRNGCKKHLRNQKS